jgi:hypothetical protein
MAAAGQSPDKDMGSNKDIVEYLSGVLKAKEAQIEN